MPYAKIRSVKDRAKQPFLYKHRLVIGYTLLMIAFSFILIFLPSISPGGINQDEINSVVEASHISKNTLLGSGVVNLPYLLLQKASIYTFGLSLYSIKLPSIIIGVFSGLFIILLLNRWFKNDVAIIGSILTTLSAGFLTLAGIGTPTIMYIFWLTFILWLGSKIVGNKKPGIILTTAFMAAIGLSLYTPLLIYVTVAIAMAGLIHPHLRFALKKCKPTQSIIGLLTFILCVTPLVISCFRQPEDLYTLGFMKDFSFETYLSNIANAFAPFFSFSIIYDTTYLAPIFGLATVALIIIGGLASIGKLFTSRNSVVGMLIIFSILISGLNKSAAISIVVPIAILTAAAIESIIAKWFSLFPENPYAHILGAAPVACVTLIIVISGLSHFIYGYHYSPRISENFSNDITLINKHLEPGTVLVIDDAEKNNEFYSLFGKYNSLTVTLELPQRIETPVAYLGGPSDETEALDLKQIITSPKSRNSDRLYIYEKSVPESTEEEKGEE